MLLPTCTSAGLAAMPSMVGQTFRTPVTMTLPVRGASWQVIGTLTAAVAPAVMAKPAEPAQALNPSVGVAVRAIW